MLRLRHVLQRPWFNRHCESVVLPEAAPLDVWAIAGGDWEWLVPTNDARSQDNARLAEANAARFILRTLRQHEGLRRGFPRALSDGENGPFCQWLRGPGGERFALSSEAIANVSEVFRSKPGKKVYDVYLNDPELQRYFPLALLPIGQHHFLGWLTTYGRADQGLSDEQILWFLHESAEDLQRGVCLTYLLNPKWQEQFPLALTKQGWAPFKDCLARAYGKSFGGALFRHPTILSRDDQRSLLRSYTRPKVNSRRQVLNGVNMLSHFCARLGIQQAAIWAKTALERSGLRTSCRDVPLSRGKIPSDRADWLGLEIFPITILNQAATPYFVSGYERSGLHRRENVFRIAYWNWELETIPDEWLAAAGLIDEIWSPTEFVAKAMRSRMPRPVFDMLPGVEVGDVEPVSRASLNIPENHCVFLFMFDLHSHLHRKNPLGLIRAFESAFRPDDTATLVIKTSGGDLHAADLERIQGAAQGKNVILLDKLLSRAAAFGLIGMCDCFASLHRSEGFGLALAEAMLMGKPVIATGYSGNMAFMNQDNSMLVDYNMVEIVDDSPLYPKGHSWAEPSVEHAASCMRHVYENRDEMTERARRAQPSIQRLLSLEAAGQRMLARLQQIGAD